MNKKKTRGRPKFPAGQARTSVVSLKASSVEIAAFKRAAKRARKLLTVWIRETALGAK